MSTLAGFIIGMAVGGFIAFLFTKKKYAPSKGIGGSSHTEDKDDNNDNIEGVV